MVNPLFLFFIIQSVLIIYWIYLLLHSRCSTRNVSHLPPVSVIIPTYNEEKNIARAINSVKASDYPNKVEIIVSDGGSRDKTVEIAEKLGAKVIITNKVMKAFNVNEAVKEAKHDIIVVLDADTKVERDSLRKIVAPLVNSNTVIAVGKMKPEGKGILAGFQRIEYSFVSELMYAHACKGTTLPFFFGAFIAIRKDFFLEAGGFSIDTPGEDMDLFVEALERGKKVAGTDATAITKVPTRVLDLVRQRLRWSKAGILIALKHRKILHRYPLYLYLYWPFYGFLGYPFLLEMFLRYLPWHLQQGTILHYLLSWTTFYGPLYSFLNLPVWGFPPLATLGVTLGMLSLFLFLKTTRKTPNNLLYLFFLPLYGTFLIGFILFLTLPYTVFTLKEKGWIKR